MYEAHNGSLPRCIQKVFEVTVTTNTKQNVPFVICGVVLQVK